MAVTIALANQKGGVGKTTTAVNLAAELAQIGKAVIVIDIDPQANATQALGVDPVNVAGRHISQLLAGSLTPVEVLVETSCAGIRLIPSHIQLATQAEELATEIAREQLLKQALSPLGNLADYVLIDCPPSLGLLTNNALTAANYVIVPLQTEPFAVEGLSSILDTIEKIRRKTNAQLRLMGILLTLYEEEYAHARKIVKEMRNTFGPPRNLVFETIIPRYGELTKAAVGGPIRNYRPGHKAVELFANLAGEVIERAGK